ncbi:hypothetical protein WN944_001353 [Citrus x changshan-huyou]|uniref:Uncharacterized protein n=1 Tax=Citrus x changshan-huyou TaxID=2935761 RepID=A0AAP0QQN3_9ROSI
MQQEEFFTSYFPSTEATSEIEAVQQRPPRLGNYTGDEWLSIDDGWKLLRPKGDDGSGFVTGDNTKS